MDNADYFQEEKMDWTCVLTFQRRIFKTYKYAFCRPAFEDISVLLLLSFFVWDLIYVPVNFYGYEWGFFSYFILNCQNNPNDVL